MMYSDNQLLSLVIAQKCSSALSIIGSSFILQDIIKNRLKRSKVFYRLLASMSTSDIICSIGFFVGTWAIPIDTPNVHNPKGNNVTCQIQAFAMYGALTTLNFNACLAAYYYISIIWGWNESKIRTKKFEPSCYVYAVGIGLTVATIPLILDYYGPANFWCSIQPSDETKHLWLLWYIPAWFNVVFVTFAMASIYALVVQTEKKSQTYDFEITQQQQQQPQQQSQRRLPSFFQPRNSMTASSSSPSPHQELNNNNTINPQGPTRKEPKRTSSLLSLLQQRRRRSSNNNRRRQSQRVAMQAILYCMAFYLTMLFPSLTRILQAFGSKDGGGAPYPILLLFMIFYPLQGFMNFLVYMRLRWRWPKTTGTFFPCCCCCCNSDNNRNGEEDQQQQSSSLNHCCGRISKGLSSIWHCSSSRSRQYNDNCGDEVAGNHHHHHHHGKATKEQNKKPNRKDSITRNSSIMASHIEENFNDDNDDYANAKEEHGENHHFIMGDEEEELFLNDIIVEHDDVDYDSDDDNEVEEDKEKQDSVTNEEQKDTHNDDHHELGISMVGQAPTV